MAEASVERLFDVPTTLSVENAKALEFRNGIKKISSGFEELFGTPVVEVTYTEWRKGDISKIGPFLPESEVKQTDFFSHEAVIACFSLGNVEATHSQRKMVLNILQASLPSYRSYTFEDVFGNINILVRFNL